MSTGTVTVIIPTYRRPEKTVENTLRSILLDRKSSALIKEIILIDQNKEPLVFSDPEVLACLEQGADQEGQQEALKIIHITGLAPSVTKAKNVGVGYATGDILVFFDDDVTVLDGCIQTYVETFLKNPNIGYLGGRETLDQHALQESKFRSRLRALLDAMSKPEPDYQVNGTYIGRIKANSFMIKNFDVETDRLVKIDGARGCNWACRKELFFKAGGFDEHYAGTALREETDLYMRLNRIGAQGFFLSRARVIHHRQSGGCENLADGIRIFRSKLDNESYFQKKFFSHRSKIFFLLRTAPLMLQSLKDTKGLSFCLWLAAVVK